MSGVFIHLSSIDEEQMHEGLNWIASHPKATLKDLPIHLRNQWIDPYFYLQEKDDLLDDTRMTIFRAGFMSNPVYEDISEDELFQYYLLWQIKLSFAVLISTGSMTTSAEEIQLFEFTAYEKKEYLTLIEVWKTLDGSNE